MPLSVANSLPTIFVRKSVFESGSLVRAEIDQRFNLTDQELNDLSDFLEWTSRINTQGWPPNDAG